MNYTIITLQEYNRLKILRALKNMPLLKGKKNISANIRELYADNKKKGKERGAKGKPRSRKQIIAIALSVAKKRK